MFKAIKGAIDKALADREAAKQARLAEEAERQRQEQAYVDALQRGQLPTVRSSLMLNPDEVCFLESPTTYVRQLKSGPKEAQGTLTVTSTRILFTTPTGEGSWKIGLDNVMAVNGTGRRFDLQTGSARGSGTFVTQAAYAGLILEAAAKLFKRLMVMATDDSSGPKSRRIPQEVKVAVWQRDQGRCVQCSATEYLEFDHVIPFSKGGANTLNNVQLLCRRCNLAKSNRI